jgi:hypothetical protein
MGQGTVARKYLDGVRRIVSITIDVVLANGGNLVVTCTGRGVVIGRILREFRRLVSELFRFRIRCIGGWW